MHQSTRTDKRMDRTIKNRDFAKVKRLGLASFFLLMIISITTPVWAQCYGCVEEQCEGATKALPPHHEKGEKEILEKWTEQFVCYRHWLVGNEEGGKCDKFNNKFSKFFRQHVLNGMTIMTEQMSAVGMQQMMMVGQFFDAKTQLESQRLFQELQVEAHKDYQPSEDFCWFGTNTRSLAATEQKVKYNKLAMSAAQMTRQLGKAHASGAQSQDHDKASRWEQFTNVYCDPKDNNWTAPNTGLFFACNKKNAPTAPRRVNADVDFGRLIEEPRTLNVDFTNQTQTNDEVDVLALGNNLYGHNVLTRNAAQKLLQYQEYQHLYMALRSVAAKRAVAQNSYDSIVSMKAAGSDDISGQQGAAPFMKAIYAELGIPAKEIEDLIGKNPSYYTQLEMLSKKIVQNPDFFSNLYDKPANIKRKEVALQAVDLMLDRAVLESELRQEMALSVLLSSMQNDRFREINKNLGVPSNTTGENVQQNGGGFLP